MEEHSQKEGLIAQIGVLLFVLAFSLDQFTKAIIQEQVGPKVIVDGQVSLVLKETLNQVFAFSIPAPTWFVFAITVPLFVAVAVMWGVALYKKQSYSFWIPLVLAGGAGNLFDRINHGGVIDWIEVSVGRYHWSSFNLADIFIIIGALGWLLHSHRAKQEATT